MSSFTCLGTNATCSSACLFSLGGFLNEDCMHDHPRLAGGVQVQTALPCYDRELKPIAATIIMTSYGNDHRNIDKSKKKKRERERERERKIAMASNLMAMDSNRENPLTSTTFKECCRVLSTFWGAAQWPAMDGQVSWWFLGKVHYCQ